MITVNKGEVKMQGGIALLSAELACVVRGLNEAFTEKVGSDEAKELITRSVKDAFKTEEEIRKETEDLMKGFMEFMKNEVFGGK